MRADFDLYVILSVAATAPSQVVSFLTFSFSAVSEFLFSFFFLFLLFYALYVLLEFHLLVDLLYVHLAFDQVLDLRTNS